MNNKMDIVFFCREGFEGECQVELSELLGHHCLQTSQLNALGPGLVLLTLERDSFKTHRQVFSVDMLVFSRQVIFDCQVVSDLDQEDRVTAVLAASEEVFSSGGQEKLYVETLITHSHAEESKKLQSFCKSFSIPFQNALRRADFKKVFSRRDLPSLYVVFISYTKAIIGLSLPELSSPILGGIMRLKAPKNAPSRSVLKLEEGFHYFLRSDQFDHYLDPRFKAVDLGAAPGGWTSLFVQRGIYVAAVDHGRMSADLMQTGLVDHVAEDAFKYRPKKPVDWLVCDMVEKPRRVAELISKWILRGDCRYIICNLKLPMKKRFEEYAHCRDYMIKTSKIDSAQFHAKHLYHDRQEVTLFIDLA